MKRFIYALALVLALPSLWAAQHADGNYVVTLVGNMSPDTVLRQHGLGATKKWTRAIHGFAAHLNGNQADRLEQDTRVLYVEPDAAVHSLAQTLPTGVRRIGCTNNALWNASAVTPINADIAIIDTGIDLTHPDLNVYANTTFVTGTTTGNDDNGHGTHCAGIAAAKNNSIGVVGVAPGARLWAVKVLDSTGSGSMSQVISGVDYVYQHAAEIEVASLSLGGWGVSEALHSAIQNCISSGVVFVAAAGNDSFDIFNANGYGDSDDFIPAAFPEVMTVSSLADSDGLPGGSGASMTISGHTDLDDSLSWFTNYGLSIATDNPVTSPGGSIDVAAPGDNIYSTYKGGTYATLSGTSMACPHVAGAVALYAAQYGLTKTAAGVYAARQALINCGSPQSAWGVNDPNPIHKPDHYPEPLIDTAHFGAASLYPNVFVSTPWSGAIWAPTDSIRFSGSATDATDGDLSAAIAWTSSIDGALGVGATITHTLTAGTHTIQASVVNSLGLTGRYTVPSIRITGTAGAPVVTITAPVNGSTHAVTDVIVFTGSATAAGEGDISSRLVWSSNNDGIIGYGGSFSNFLSAAALHVIYAGCTNLAGAGGGANVNITVTGTAPPPPPVNYPPTVSIVQPANGLSVPSGTAVTCVGTASDTTDGDLSASIVWSDNLAGGLGKGASATYTPAAGTHTITAQVADSAGAVSTDTHTLTVTSAGTPLTVAVAANKAAYVNKEKALLTTTVTSGGTAVSGATVTVQVRSGSRSVATKTGTTTSAGTFAFYLPIQKSKYGSGAGPFTATVTSNASKTAYVSGVGSTTFLVY